ncbi:MAG: hypothetical protein P3A28_05640 [Gemmatimonadota bacterium]|nr:hypothetical protein [Gemmatimonadota bacterium]
MRLHRLVILALALSAPVAAAEAQFSLGLGGGTGMGTRGGSSGGGHGNVSLQLKLPILPGVRGDVYALDVPSDSGRFAAAVSVVIAAPIPLVTPYLIAGLGQYGLAGDAPKTGWNAGVGVSASVVIGPSVFVELRRHQRVARDMVTIGVRF